MARTYLRTRCACNWKALMMAMPPIASWATALPAAKNSRCRRACFSTGLLSLSDARAEMGISTNETSSNFQLRVSI